MQSHFCKQILTKNKSLPWFSSWTCFGLKTNQELQQQGFSQCVKCIKILRQTYQLGFEYKSEYTKHKNIVMTHKELFKSVDPQPFINSCGAAFFSPLTLSAIN